jgi:hypothetical protein
VEKSQNPGVNSYKSIKYKSKKGIVMLERPARRTRLWQARAKHLTAAGLFLPPLPEIPHRPDKGKKGIGTPPE